MSTGLNQIRPVFNMIWHLKDFQRFKDLKNFPRRTTSDKVLRDKAFEIASNAKYEYKCGLASMV